MAPLRFRYRLNPAVLFGAAGLFLFYAFALAVAAGVGEDFRFYGLHFQGLAARVGGFAAAAFFTALAAAALRIHVLAGRRQPELELLTDVLRVPESMWRRRPTDIPYDRIRSMRALSVRGQQLFYVHADRDISIARGLLPSRAAFDQVVQELVRRAPQAQVEWGGGLLRRR